MSEKLLAALKTLDPTKDEHWTADGLPKIEALGIEGLKRADITKAAPQFTRANPTLELPPPSGPAKAPEPKTSELSFAERKAVAEANVARLGKIATEARHAYDRAVAQLDELIATQDRAERARSEQAPIMEYLAAKQARREAGRK